MSFTPQDLERLDAFLGSADAVIPLREVARGDHDPRHIALRHDIDDDPERSLRFARWEHERGYRASYFVLHTAAYYRDKTTTFSILTEIEALGHEVGLHNDAVTVAIEAGWDDPVGSAPQVLEIVLGELREARFDIAGIAAHGSSLCKNYGVNNMDVWERFELADFGLEYAAYLLHRGGSYYVSDNGGEWRAPRELHPEKQTHVLVHPQHWPI